MQLHSEWVLCSIPGLVKPYVLSTSMDIFCKTLDSNT